MTKRQRGLLLGVLLAVGLPVAAFAIMSFTSRKPDNLGVRDNRLADCPSSPNCVSSQASEVSKQIDAIPFTGTPEEAIERLRQVIAGMSGGKVVTVEGNYLHAEFTSRVFRFVDDVECLVVPAERVIHLRSASRAGYSDMGVNRRRVEEIRQRFAAP